MTAEPPRAGSVPARLRNAFIDLLEDETQGDQACQLLRQLVASTDTLPQEYCDMLELPEGSTFGDAARRMQAQLGCETSAG